MLSVLSFCLLHRNVSYQKERNSTEDSLTGLPNRNYFRNVYGDDGFFNTLSYRSLAVLDIDSFVSVESETAADSALLILVSSVKKFFEDKGLCIRWSRDCFVLFSEFNTDKTVSLCQSICSSVKKTCDLSLSVGVAEILLADTIKKNYYRALLACYQIKKDGGDGVREV